MHHNANDEVVSMWSLSHLLICGCTNSYHPCSPLPTLLDSLRFWGLMERCYIQALMFISFWPANMTRLRTQQRAAGTSIPALSRRKLEGGLVSNPRAAICSFRRMKGSLLPCAHTTIALSLTDLSKILSRGRNCCWLTTALLHSKYFVHTDLTTLLRPAKEKKILPASNLL